MIYLIPLILLILGCFVYDRPHMKQKGLFLWGMVYVLLVLIFGLRYKVGGDTYNYINYFSWAPELSDWQPIDFSGFEPGFSLLTSLIKTWTDNIYIYQTILSAIMTYMLMTFVKRETEYKYLAMLLIFLAMYIYFSTEIIRESLAIGAFLLSYIFLEKKKYLYYYIICLILISIHASATICLVFPLCKYLRFNIKFYICILAFVPIGFLMSKLMDYISGFMIFEKLLRYNKHSYVGYLWCGLRFLYFSILPFCTLLFCKKRLKVHMRFEGIICFQIILGFGIWFVPIVFQRLINYTIIIYLVSLADVIGKCLRNQSYFSIKSSNKAKNNMLLAKILLILTIFAHCSFYIHLNFYERYIPYHSVFDPVDEYMREKYVSGDN